MGGQVDVMILFTGVGTKTLIETLKLKFSLDEIKASLEKLTLIARGPKPTRVLSELGLKPSLIIPEPNTWREMLRTLDQKKVELKGKKVAVQEYGEPNKIFEAELKERGATVWPVQVYRAELPEDLTPLKNLVDEILNENVDVLMFTNATQVFHLMMVARQEGKAQELRRQLEKVVIGSVGPICSDTIRSFGLPVDIQPERPKMGALVAAVADGAEKIINAKNKNSLDIEILLKLPLKSKNVLYDSLFMRACRKEPTDRTPLWLMRQAGRYMKEYRELRAKVSFSDLCKNSDLAAEVTVDAAQKLGVDAAIIFSDILLLLEPLGFNLTYEEKGGPQITNPFRKTEDLKRLQSVDVLDSLRFVFDAIRKTRVSLQPDIPLIGFVGAPFTLVSYLIEGKSSKNFVLTKRMMYEHENTWHKLLEKITENLIPLLNEQIKAGAQAVQIFDSWAGCLTPEDYRRYVLPYSKRLIQGVTPGIPVISFATQTAGLLPILKQAGGDVIGVDWRVELDEAWRELGDVAIMGNLDPVILYSTKENIRVQAKRILNQAAGRPGHIFNLGHGVLPETPIENVLSLVQSVKELSQRPPHKRS